jgi:hypothetical protein
MAFVEVRVNGLSELLKKVHDVEQLKFVTSALEAGAEQIKSNIAEYPPASMANNPANKRWYERGYGPRWQGGSGGKKTSEMLGRKWTIAKKHQGLTVVIGNNVSYGPYVQDEDKQAHFHRERGWKTTKKAAEEEAPKILEFIRDYLRRQLNK